MKFRVVSRTCRVPRSLKSTNHKTADEPRQYEVGPRADCQAQEQAPEREPPPPGVRGGQHARHKPVEAPEQEAIAARDGDLVLEGPPEDVRRDVGEAEAEEDRKSTRLNSSHQLISYAVFCL